jgi:hypothetical protein
MAEQDRNTSSPEATGHPEEDSGNNQPRGDGHPEEDSGNNQPRGDGRRELLKKLGRYGLYTAPALLAMFETIETAAAS